jgi:hypothetical protein
LSGEFDRRAYQKRSKRGAGNAPGEARGNHWQCSNGADGGAVTAHAAEVVSRMAFLRRRCKNGLVLSGQQV